MPLDPVRQFFRQSPRVTVLLQPVHHIVSNGVPFLLAKSLPKSPDEFACPDEGVGNRKPEHVATGSHGPMRTYHEQKSSRRQNVSGGKPFRRASKKPLKRGTTHGAAR